MAALFKKAKKVKRQQSPASSEAVDVAVCTSEDSAARTRQLAHTSDMEQELARAREELSRAVLARDRCEIDMVRREAELCHCREDLARSSAIKTDVENENQKLQAEVASLERELARTRSDQERLKEDMQRLKGKLVNKKRLLVALKTEVKDAGEENRRLEESAKEREHTWQTLRRDLTTRRDDAVREACKLRRENERLKLRVRKVKIEKSSVLLRLWEKNQADRTSAGQSCDDAAGGDVTNRNKGTTEVNDRLQAKVMSLELQLFRQARLVELLLDVIQEHDAQFTKKQREDLTSAFTDAGSKPVLLARKWAMFP